LLLLLLVVVVVVVVSLLRQHVVVASEFGYLLSYRSTGCELGLATSVSMHP
jgi:hypothetical protein